MKNKREVSASKLNGRLIVLFVIIISVCLSIAVLCSCATDRLIAECEKERTVSNANGSVFMTSNSEEDFYLADNNDSKFKFYLDGVIVEKRIYVKQGQRFTLEVKADGDTKSDLEYGYNTGFIKKIGDNDYEVKDTARIGLHFENVFSVRDLETNETDFIQIYVIPDFDISFSVKYNSRIKTYVLTMLLNEKNGTIGEIDTDITAVKMNGESKTFNVKFSSSLTCDALCGFEKDKNTARITYKIGQKDQRDNAYYVYCRDGVDGDAAALINSYPNQPKRNSREIYIEPQTVDVLFDGGTGMDGDPYRISTEQQLRNMQYMSSNGIVTGSYTLINDVTVNGDFEALPVFSGIFDGTDSNNKITLSHIVARNGCYGLFSKVDYGTVKNIRLEVQDNNAAAKYAGGICGYANNALLSNCEVYGQIIANGYLGEVGGLVGVMTGNLCKIENCNNSAMLKSHAVVGGIVGHIYNGSIYNCESSARIAVTFIKGGGEPFIGGIAGMAFTGIVNNCRYSGVMEYNSREFSGKNIEVFCGNIVGHNTCDALQINNTFTGSIMDK